MTIKQVIEKYLKENKFDGLYENKSDCACAIDDLMPCDAPGTDCKAGYRLPCPKECGDHDWHIGEIESSVKEASIIDIPNQHDMKKWPPK